MVLLYSNFARRLSSLGFEKLSGNLMKQPVIQESDKGIKTYDEIPSKKGLIPSSLALMLSGGPGYLHEHCDKRHKELGPIYREYLGSTELVFLADTKSIQTVLANEGKWPQQNVPEAWTYLNNIKQIERGLFFQSGESWARLRKALNKVLLADMNEFAEYSSGIMTVTSDMMTFWRSNYLSNSGDAIIIKDIKPELDKWSIEATGFLLFGSRMGCIPKNVDTVPDSNADELVRNVATMFAETSNFQVLPVRLAHKLNLPTWRRFESSSTNMIRIAHDYANRYINETRNNTNGPHGMLRDIMSQDILTDDEISRSLVDLIIAAADTTSNSLQWMLYSIATRKECDEKILNEVEPILEKPSGVRNLMNDAPYLRAFVKEVMRLYPTAPFLARSLEKNIALNGYLIPAGTPLVFSLYTTSRSEKYFDQPNEFEPDRWLRSKDTVSCPLGYSTKNHAYASLPFGMGARNCIGRRLAEFQMYLFIASYVKVFESSVISQNINVKLKMILSPDKPISLRLKTR